jgi:GNAT superfamily N-acetyltransferase
MLIRLAQEADCERIGALWSQLVDYHRALDSNMPEAAADGVQRYAARIASLLDDPQTRTYVAEVNERIVGYITGTIADMRPEVFAEEVVGFIGDVFVEEGSRGIGIGHALVQAMEQFFASRGVLNYEWHVASANTAGQAFWRRLGGQDVVIRMRNRVRLAEDETANASDGSNHRPPSNCS